jgi:hypothetical protein
MNKHITYTVYVIFFKNAYYELKLIRTHPYSHMAN